MLMGGLLSLISMAAWPHDANLVLSVLMNVIKKREVLPDVLDNTARENKNQYVLGFLALLMEMRVFKEVGHLLPHNILCGICL